MRTYVSVDGSIDTRADGHAFLKNVNIGYSVR